ncbi:MipA/OmpV family protein, partial [Sphingosinicella sp.]|uniref:MipA/OmpV family protein n=1 Tax=Sphingosinicella sp. TaxID=1917971 RepID=UPI0040382BE8
MSKVTARIFAAALVTTSFAAPVVAQEGRGRTVTLGMGVQIAPEYYGADSYAIFPLPRFGLRREGRPMPFGAPDDSTGFGLLGQDSAFNIGPAVQLIAKREEDDVGAPVGDVGLTVEAGGFAQVFIGDNFRLRGELRQGIGGHEGLVGDIAADLILRDGDNTIFSIGPRVRWGDND